MMRPFLFLSLKALESDTQAYGNSENHLLRAPSAYVSATECYLCL